MTAAVDSAFIRRAVELADLNAVRVALYQHTHDPEIAALPMALNLDDDQRELLISQGGGLAGGERRPRACRPSRPRTSCVSS